MSDQVSSNAPHGHRSTEAAVLKNALYCKTCLEPRIYHCCIIIIILLKLENNPNIRITFIEYFQTDSLTYYLGSDGRCRRPPTHFTKIRVSLKNLDGHILARPFVKETLVRSTFCGWSIMLVGCSRPKSFHYLVIQFIVDFNFTLLHYTRPRRSLKLTHMTLK